MSLGSPAEIPGDPGGSNFPRFDRNPCNGDDFYEDADGSLAVQTTIFTDGESRLRFSIGE